MLKLHTAMNSNCCVADLLQLLDEIYCRSLVRQLPILMARRGLMGISQVNADHESTSKLQNSALYRLKEMKDVGLGHLVD
jgi:hypothetical protein